MRNLLPVLFFAGGIVALSGCASVDNERSALRGALTDARQLATEIDTWHRRSEPAVNETAVQTIESFQERAETLLDNVSGVSDEASTGVDLAGVKQALSAIAEFDTSRIESASQTGRASVMHQFGALAQNLRSAVALVHVSG